MPTDEIVFDPPHILNAKKGDIVLNPGCGIVAKLLRQVSPGQHFGHCGIMIDNGYHLVNATSSQGALEAAIAVDGVEPYEVLKYQWPGTIQQSINEAYEVGSDRIDPFGVLRNLKPFSFQAEGLECEGERTFSQVVQPPPLDEAWDPSIRDTLSAIADRAAAMNGHYRFFAYTDADIVNNGQYSAPDIPFAEWAYDLAPLPFTCSSLIWHAARSVGVLLEGDAQESADINPPGAIDGLYAYDATERRNAAVFLHGMIYNQVVESYSEDLIPTFVCQFETCATDAANQITNAFAFDWCGDEEGMKFEGETHSKDSMRWLDPGPGITVSPEDLMSWDGPDTGGVYGHHSDMQYQAGENVWVHRWAVSEGVGNVTGTAMYGGDPAFLVPLTMAGLTTAAHPAELGLVARFTFENIPAGPYRLQALDFGGLPLCLDMPVTVIAGETVELLNVVIADGPCPLAGTRRRIRVSGTINVTDDDPLWNDTGQCHVSATLELAPGERLIHTFETSRTDNRCCADEVGVVFTIELRPQLDIEAAAFPVKVYLKGRLWELRRGGCGSDEANNGGGERSNGVTVFADDPNGEEVSLTIHNLDEGGDKATIGLTIWNETIE